MKNTQTIRAIVVDDELNSRELVKLMLEKYCPQVEVLALAASVEEAFNLIEKHQPNLIFLDIEMPRGDGFELLKRIPEPDFEVIFVTGFDHYAMKAIKVHAMDYLLKPVDIDELIEAVQNAEKKLLENRHKENYERLLNNYQNMNFVAEQIAVPTKEGKIFIAIDQIIYCEADGSYTWINTQDNRYYSSKNLGEYEKILPEPKSTLKNRFFRSHNSYIVNFQFIKRYNNQENILELTNGTKIPISQRRKKQYLDFLKKFGLR